LFSSADVPITRLTRLLDWRHHIATQASQIALNVSQMSLPNHGIASYVGAPQIRLSPDNIGN
jgi:hypothetical protein